MLLVESGGQDMGLDQTKDARLRLALVGDICLAGGLQESLRSEGVDFPFRATKAAFEGADIVMGNLECCIVDDVLGPEPPKNLMKVPVSLATGLGASGINVVSLANNHILDGGEAGVASTIRFLEANGIRYFGAGRNLQEAERPLLVKSKGRTLAFLGACDAPIVHGTKTEAGVPPMDSRRLSQRVAECRQYADIVVVAIHADLEFTPYPSPSRVRMSRWLVEQGADLVIQHHPHVCQGIELHRAGLIAYSLGNFVFRVQDNEYMNKHPGTDWGLVLQVNVETEAGRNRIDYRLIPVSIDADHCTLISTGADKERQIQRLAELSDGLSSMETVRRARMTRCRAEARMNLFGLYYMLRRKGLWAAMKAAGRLLGNPYERRWMYSLFSGGMFG